MNKHIRFGLWALPALALAACTAAPPESGDAPASGPAVELDATALAPLSAKVQMGSGSMARLDLPSERLTLESFDPAVAVKRFIQTEEPFTLVGQRSKRQELESTSWRIESAPGHFVAMVKPDVVGPQVATDEDSLRVASRQRLRTWGVPDAEVGRVLQRKVMTQERVEGLAGEPRVHAHKTFIMRAIHGVEVQGHRAVITHSPEGRFERALVRWPALSSSGHALRTSLPLAAIEERARAALSVEDSGLLKAHLRWKYLAEEQPNGEVRLRLVVGARAPSSQNEGSESREVDVEVDATP